MNQKIDWIIHLVSNGVICRDCGQTETGFLPYLCNAHTHGLEKYGHQDFQLVLHFPHEEIMRILNTMGLRVQAVERFKAGDLVADIYEDCNVRLDEFEETGRNVLRVVIRTNITDFPMIRIARIFIVSRC